MKTAAFSFSMGILIFSVGCGGGGSSSAGLPSGNSTEAFAVSCAPVSGQKTQPPYFIGQNLQCTATTASGSAQPTWTTSAGVISNTGTLSQITQAGTVTINATLGSTSQRVDIEFAKPVGAPGLVFTAPLSSTAIMWDFVVDDSSRVCGAGWSSGSTPQAELFSMPFWSRQANQNSIAQASLLTNAVLANKRPLFGGANVTASAYVPLLVSSDDTPKLLTSGECAGAGILTALAFDAEHGEAWGAWSSNTQSSRIPIDPDTFQPECGSATPLLESTPSQPRVPWIWSLYATTNGTVASGHYVSGGNTTGFVVMNTQAGDEIARKEFPGLADVRITPPITEGSDQVVYIAGHDIGSGGDVWTVIKLNSSLDEIWRKTWSFSASGKNQPYSIVVSPDGGVIVAGMSTQVSASQSSVTDTMLIALSPDGGVAWGPLRINPTDDGAGSCYISSLRFTPDQRFMLAAAGCTQSEFSSYLLGFAMQ